MNRVNGADASGDSEYPTQSKGFRIVEDATYGFRRLDPIPPEGELAVFYESRYYDLARKGNRGPDLKRLMEGGAAASKEVEWLRQGLYSDIVYTLGKAGSGRDLLEVGCGTGDFITFAREQGFRAVGLEPSREAAEHAASQGLKVSNLTLGNFVTKHPDDRFDVIVMLNVLEHVPDAVRTLQECKKILQPDGMLCIRVPNDFSEIQEAAKNKLGIGPWWIAVPDHINYFNFPSLSRLLGRLGFETVHAQGDFPMEMFLLMGENYVGDPEVGSSCHARRIQFDLSVPTELRRKIYTSLASAGVGRTCLVFGKRVAV